MATVTAMAKRPSADSGATKHVRVFQDLAEMIGWVVQIRGVSAANYLDPLLRSTVESDFRAIKHIVDSIKKQQKAGG